MGFLVAEVNGEIVGYSISWIRSSLWYLMELFVLPAHQGKGIGRGLIEKTMESWQHVKITSRAVITPAYNPSSISLYTRFGMFPREPLYFATAPPDTIEKHAIPAIKKAEFQVTSNYRKVARVLRSIDQEVLGFQPDWHHEFFFEVQRAKCLIFEKNGRREGYAYVRENGRVGPMAVLRKTFFEKAMTSTLDFAADQDPKKVLVLVPGSNEHAISIILKRGLEIVAPMLFMSSKRVAICEKYLCYSPGLM